MLEQITQEIALEYVQNTAKAIQLITGIVRKNKKEGFSATYSNKVISLEAENPLSAAFGMGFFSTIVPSGHYADFLGPSTPLFGLRPLWLGSECFVPLTEKMGINLPKGFLDYNETQCHQVCKRIIELGYNGIMIGLRENAPCYTEKYSAEKIAQLFKLFKRYQLKIIIKPHFIDAKKLRSLGRSPFNRHYKKYVQEALKELFSLSFKVDYFYWEGSFFYPDCIHHPSAKTYTQADLAKAEVQMLEEVINHNIQLIYCLPAVDLNTSMQQANWFSRFCDEVGNQTLLAFPVVAGEPCSDHFPLHPFWNALRKSPDSSYTKLLPIMNTGGIKQGEGLWPSLSLDLFERCIGRCYRHHFGGIISLVNHLPAKGGLLDCNLWVASQMMWRKQKADILAETWFSAHRPELNYVDFTESLRLVREVVIKLSLLRSLTIEKNRDAISSEECRLLTDNLIAQLKYLQFAFSKRMSRTNHLSFADFYSPFFNDARNIIHHFLQCFNIPLTTSFGDQNSTEGFWTEIMQGSGRGMRSSTKIKFYDEPKFEPKRETETKIYNSNFFRISDCG